MKLTYSFMNGEKWHVSTMGNCAKRSHCSTCRVVLSLCFCRLCFEYDKRDHPRQSAHPYPSHDNPLDLCRHRRDCLLTDDLCHHSTPKIKRPCSRRVSRKHNCRNHLDRYPLYYPHCDGNPGNTHTDFNG